jgi:hypothetical protein
VEIVEKCWLLFIIFAKLPKEKNHPVGNNSTNLVTLILVFQKETTNFSKEEKFKFGGRYIRATGRVREKKIARNEAQPSLSHSPVYATNKT